MNYLDFPKDIRSLIISKIKDVSTIKSYLMVSKGERELLFNSITEIDDSEKIFRFEIFLKCPNLIRVNTFVRVKSLIELTELELYLISSKIKSIRIFFDDERDSVFPFKSYDYRKNAINITTPITLSIVLPLWKRRPYNLLLCYRPPQDVKFIVADDVVYIDSCGNSTLENVFNYIKPKHIAVHIPTMIVENVSWFRNHEDLLSNIYSIGDEENSSLKEINGLKILYYESIEELIRRSF